MTRPNTRWFLSKLPLAIILLSGAFLRFYDLGRLPLDPDEALVPLTARHSLAYIFSFCSVQEMHPPLFYCITKAILLLSSSDIILRSVSAFFGMASIYLLYRIAREFIDEETGLLAAAFLSINILHFLLSQAARPYSLQTALFLAAFWLVARLLKRGQWKDLFLLCCVNFLLFWLHYFAYYMVAAQGAVLALGLFSTSSPVTRKQFAAFCFFTVLTAVPVYIWFVLPSLAHQVSSMHLPRQTILSVISEKDLRAASIFASPQFSWANLMYLAPLAGWLVCLLRKPKFAALCLALGGIPLALVVVQAPGYPMDAWHVVWLTPLLSLCVAMLFSWLPRAEAAGRFSIRRSLRILAPLLVVSGSLLILSQLHDLDLKEFTPRYDLRATAKLLSPMLSPETLTTEATTPGFFTTMSWYMDQSPPNPLAIQNLEPGDTPITLHFIGGRVSGHDLGGDPGAYVLKAMREQGKVDHALHATLYTVQVNRQPITAIESLPATFSFPAHPRLFYSRVYRLHNVRSVAGYTVWGYPILDRFRHQEGGVIATVNNQPVFFEFVLENTMNYTPVQLSAILQYLNIGSGNRIGLYARFDNEPILPLATRTGPDPNRSLSLSFSRNTPFKRLTFLVLMYCKDDTAMLFGDNLRTLLFQQLSVNITKAGDAPLPKPQEK